MEHQLQEAISDDYIWGIVNGIATTTPGCDIDFAVKVAREAFAEKADRFRDSEPVASEHSRAIVSALDRVSKKR